MTFLERDLRWDGKIIIVRDLGNDSVWDGKIKNLVYDTILMDWVAQTSTSGGSGGAVTISASTSSVETRSMAMKTLVDESTTTVTYVGDAATGSATSGSLWRIKRLTQSGTVLIIEWANGNGNFSNIWDNRVSLGYS